MGFARADLGNGRNQLIRVTIFQPNRRGIQLVQRRRVQDLGQPAHVPLCVIETLGVKLLARRVNDGPNGRICGRDLCSHFKSGHAKRRNFKAKRQTARQRH